MWTQLKRWWAAGGTMVQLQRLDDRLLTDMGLERAGLRARVMGEAEVKGGEKAGCSAVLCEGC